ncbi:MFS transporter [Gordonia sp. ABSL1-1]|uniref:MFS transporter n=1 Tax=Gordonia sp. ABSL1-1 TaxID=3053923 RepID=UPI002573D44C|nr:MFS transporter [Gordonia sp. ABSL1-1]MDL9936958.1 MFS transporter [Gordonia sp. ABSL1-1]
MTTTDSTDVSGDPPAAVDSLTASDSPTISTAYADSAPAAQSGDAHPRRRWWALAVIALAQLIVVLDATIITIALPYAQNDLHISDANRQWSLTAYTLLFGSLLLLGGRLADHLGRRRMFLIGLAGFAVSSAFAGLAWNSVSFFAGRALQGVFAAMLAPAALALIAVMFTEHRDRARALAVYAAVSGAGAAIGLIAGGALTEYLSWRWTLLINTPIALIAAAGALYLVTRDRAALRGRGYDLPGVVTVTGGLFALVYAFTRAESAGWGAASTIGFFVLAGVLLSAFVTIEARTADPMLPLRIPGDINRGGAYLVSLIVPIPMFAMFMFLSYYFQNTLGHKPLEAGLLFLPFPIALVFSAGLASSLLPRIGPRPLMIAGPIIGALSLLYLAQLDVDSTWVADILPAEVGVAVGMGLVFVAMQSVGLHRIDVADAGVGSALINTTQQVGGSIGLALLSTIAASALADYVGDGKAAAIHSYDVAFYWGAGFMALALLVSVLTIRVGRDEMREEASAVAVG